MPSVTNYDVYLSNIANASSSDKMLVFVQQTSYATRMLPGTFILAAVFTILFLSLILRGEGTLKALTAASFAHCVLAILMYPMGIIFSAHFYIALIMPALAVLALWASS
jgi:hypothetical protein